MPKAGLIASALISLALVGGALWFRFLRIPPYSAELATIQQTNQFPSEDTLENAENLGLLNASSTYTTASDTPLTETASLSRGLFSEYMGLKSQGKVTPENLDILAGKYAEQIANYDLGTEKITYSQILTVPDSAANLTLYGNTMTSILTKYKNLVMNLYKNSGNITEIGSPAFSAFMSEVGKLYKASANELLSVRAPNVVAQNHMNLINNYLESATIMESISSPSKNPVQTLAALNLYGKNKDSESKILANIQKVMIANGIIWSSGI